MGSISWERDYGYDAFGNRSITAQTSLTSPPSINSFDASTNRLNSASYDDAGNMTSDTVNRVMTYDAENRMTTFTHPGVGSLLDCESVVSISISLLPSLNWARRLTKGKRQASSEWCTRSLHPNPLYCNIILESIYSGEVLSNASTTRYDGSAFPENLSLILPVQKGFDLAGSRGKC